MKLTFDSEAKRQQLVDLIEPYAAFIKENEPTTLSYQVLLSDKDPKGVQEGWKAAAAALRSVLL